jgi:predicted phosphate transport protein (TIGR00153 family)
MNNSLLNRFTPKEPKFFDFLKQISDICVSVSGLLLESLQTKSVEDHRAYFTKVKELEREADKIGRSIFDALESSFITPLDREDIHDLATGLDDVIDLINSCAKRLAIYNPKGYHELAIELAQVVAEDAKCLKKAMEALTVMKKRADGLKECIERLHTLENQADEIYENGLIRLFEEEKDAVELIKTKEILSELEKTTDAAEHIGKTLKAIVVKYA